MFFFGGGVRGWFCCRLEEELRGGSEGDVGLGEGCEGCERVLWGIWRLGSLRGC